LVGAATEVERVLAELRETPYEPLREEQEEEISEGKVERQVKALNNALIYFFKGNARNPACSFSSSVVEECQICKKGDHLATTCPRLNEARLRYAKCNMLHRMENFRVKYTSCAESGYSEDKIWKGHNNGKSRFETANFAEALVHKEEATQGIDTGRRFVNVMTPYEELRAKPNNTKKEHLDAAEDKVSMEVVEVEKEIEDVLKPNKEVAMIQHDQTPLTVQETEEQLHKAGGNPIDAEIVGAVRDIKKTEVEDLNITGELDTGLGKPLTFVLP